jgi:hypothetical protein
MPTPHHCNCAPVRLAALLILASGLPLAAQDPDSIPNLCETGQLDPGFCSCIAREYADEPYADCLLTLVSANQIDLAAAQKIADLIGSTGILEHWYNSQGAACYTDICSVPYCGQYNPQCVHAAPLCIDWDADGNCVDGYGCERDYWTGYLLCGGDNGTADTPGCFNRHGTQQCVE